MRCDRCGRGILSAEIEAVADHFDDWSDGLCYNCAEEVSLEREQDSQMSDVCQDEGD